MSHTSIHFVFNTILALKLRKYYEDLDSYLGGHHLNELLYIVFNYCIFKASKCVCISASRRSVSWRPGENKRLMTATVQDHKGKVSSRLLSREEASVWKEG